MRALGRIGSRDHLHIRCRQVQAFRARIVCHGLSRWLRHHRTEILVPIGRFLLSSITRGRASGYLDWVSLGPVSQFPEGETRLATFRNALVMPTDGKTVDTACWVRRVEGDRFQVFAVNCAHLGCPVRWFPQSGIFMCPCHGGAYYRDGSRASGPPERGLFEYQYKVEKGLITIQAGEMPTPGPGASLMRKEPPCA